LRIVLDKNVPVGVRRFPFRYEVRTFAEMHWRPQFENGKLPPRRDTAGSPVRALQAKPAPTHASAARIVER
jgi:hypothetical protein